MLTNGCLCCTVREDLVKVLNNLWKRKSEFDHILIETTGIANPGPIISSFYMDQQLPDRVRLDGVVTVVDAKHVERHLNEEKQDDTVNEAVEQIAYADRIVLNKTDLVEPSYLTDLTSRIRAINDMASISATRRSQVPVDYVLGVGGFDLDKIGEEVEALSTSKKHDHSHKHDHEHEHNHGPDCDHEHHDHHHDHNHNHSHDHDHNHHHHHHHDDKVTSVSFSVEGDMDLDKVHCDGM
eukprot:jgi/Chrzof1/5370/Cz16g00110.t1